MIPHFSMSGLDEILNKNPYAVNIYISENKKWKQNLCTNIKKIIFISKHENVANRKHA